MPCNLAKKSLILYFFKMMPISALRDNSVCSHKKEVKLKFYPVIPLSQIFVFELQVYLRRVEVAVT